MIQNFSCTFVLPYEFCSWDIKDEPIYQLEATTINYFQHDKVEESVDLNILDEELLFFEEHTQLYNANIYYIKICYNQIISKYKNLIRKSKTPLHSFIYKDKKFFFNKAYMDATQDYYKHQYGRLIDSKLYDYFKIDLNPIDEMILTLGESIFKSYDIKEGIKIPLEIDKVDKVEVYQSKFFFNKFSEHLYKIRQGDFNSLTFLIMNLDQLNIVQLIRINIMIYKKQINLGNFSYKFNQLYKKKKKKFYYDIKQVAHMESIPQKEVKYFIIEKGKLEIIEKKEKELF